MFAKRKIATGVLTLAVALATGHVMQYGIAPEEHVEAPAPRPSAARPSSGRPAETFSNTPVIESGFLDDDFKPFDTGTSLGFRIEPLGDPAGQVVTPASVPVLEQNTDDIPCPPTAASQENVTVETLMMVPTDCVAGSEAENEHAG